MQNAHLQSLCVQGVLDGMQVCSQQGQRNIQILLEALKTPGAGAELAHDAMFALHKIAARCSIAQQWILQLP